MSRFPTTFIVFVLVAVLCSTLKIHHRNSAHTLAESPELLTNLTQAEGTVRAKLAIMFSQLTAANTTLSQNLYIQKVENGTLKLLPANQSVIADPSITKCLYFT